MVNYFKDCKTGEECKQTYKKWARILHPDCNPDKDTTADFQKLQEEFEKVYSRLKNIHINKEGEKYHKETQETPKEYMDIINALLRIQGIVVEVCGSWIWVSGQTKEVKETLKSLGFRFSRNKLAWYYTMNNSPRKRRPKFSSMDEVRNAWGSQKFASEEAVGLNG